MPGEETEQKCKMSIVPLRKMLLWTCDDEPITQTVPFCGVVHFQVESFLLAFTVKLVAFKIVVFQKVSASK